MRGVPDEVDGGERAVADGDRVAVKATSQASSSGYTKEILIDSKEYPIIQWQWKVSNVLKAGNVTKKEGDDYPARIYVTFQYDSAKVGLFGKAKYETAKLIYGRYPPLGALNYIWESRAAVGTAVGWAVAVAVAVGVGRACSSSGRYT